jgi:hypothetical protein
MPTINALEFFELGSDASKVAHSIFFTARVGSHDLAQYEKETIKANIIALADICKRIGLPTCLQLLKDRENDPPQSRREWDMLVATVRAELQTNVFVFVPMHRAKYYEMVLEGAVTAAFSTASKELVSAGNALAVGLYTATVFHSMRAAEIGVRVLGKELGVSYPDKPLELADWQNILDQADSKIIAMKALPRGTHKDEELNFYSQAAVQFRYFKDAWRVRVAHARETYEESAAIKVFSHTLEFFETLAIRLKE